MSPFDFTVCQLQIGCQSRPSPEAQSIAQSIVEQYILKGYDITRGVSHRAVDQAAVDYSAE